MAVCTAVTIVAGKPRAARSERCKDVLQEISPRNQELVPVLACGRLYAEASVEERVKTFGQHVPELLSLRPLRLLERVVAQLRHMPLTTRVVLSVRRRRRRASPRCTPRGKSQMASCC